MGYDAVWVAQTATRFTDKPITPGKVLATLGQLHDKRQVPGVSGYISLINGNPVNKAIPILRLSSKGKASFVELTSPEGTPLAGEHPDQCPDGQGAPAGA